MNVVSTVQENAEDIYAEAVEINEERAAKKECFEDEAEGFEEVDDEAESADAEAAAEAGVVNRFESADCEIHIAQSLSIR